MDAQKNIAGRKFSSPKETTDERRYPASDPFSSVVSESFPCLQQFYCAP